MHSDYLCLSWPRASPNQELRGVWLFCGEQTVSSPPSWKKPQKQSLSQLQSKGPVFTLLRHCAALWPRTQAMKPLWGFPEVPGSRLAPADSYHTWHYFLFHGSWFFFLLIHFLSASICKQTLPVLPKACLSSESWLQLCSTNQPYFFCVLVLSWWFCKVMHC